MNWVEKYLLKEARKTGRTKLIIGIVAAAILTFGLILSKDAKSSHVWPPESDLAVASGFVTWLESDKRSIKFRLSNSPYTFSYMPLYGRKMKDIARVLRQESKLITVGFELKTGSNELGIERKTQTIFTMKSDAIPILTYAESQKTFAEDQDIIPWLLALSVFGLIGFSWSLRLLAKHGLK